MLATLLFRPLDFDVGGPLHAVKHVDSSGRASALWVSDVSLVHKCGVQSASPLWSFLVALVASMIK